MCCFFSWMERRSSLASAWRTLSSRIWSSIDGYPGSATGSVDAPWGSPCSRKCGGGLRQASANSFLLAVESGTTDSRNNSGGDSCLNEIVKPDGCSISLPSMRLMVTVRA